jgi:hypothetical protein
VWIFIFQFILAGTILSCRSGRSIDKYFPIKKSFELCYQNDRTGEIIPARLEIRRDYDFTFRMVSPKLNGVFPFDARYTFQKTGAELFCWGGMLNSGTLLRTDRPGIDSTGAVAYEIQKVVYGKYGHIQNQYYLWVFEGSRQTPKYYLEYSTDYGFTKIEILEKRVRYQLVTINKKSMERTKPLKSYGIW